MSGVLLRLAVSMLVYLICFGLAWLLSIPMSPRGH